jgi:hypothetical protein
MLLPSESVHAVRVGACAFSALPTAKGVGQKDHHRQAHGDLDRGPFEGGP